VLPSDLVRLAALLQSVLAVLARLLPRLPACGIHSAVSANMVRESVPLELLVNQRDRNTFIPRGHPVGIATVVQRH
jgi:hypothetical protein